MAGCAPVYAFGVEPNWLERTFHRVKLPCKNLTSGVRILHLSDFHASHRYRFRLIEKSVELGLEAKPDVICLTGDFVTDATPFDEAEYARILRRLSSAAPVFATLGNHDGGAWAARAGGFKDSSVVRELLRAGNVPLLHNRSEVVRVRDQSIRFAGVADLWSQDVDGDLRIRECLGRRSGDSSGPQSRHQGCAGGSALGSDAERPHARRPGCVADPRRALRAGSR